MTEQFSSIHWDRDEESEESPQQPGIETGHTTDNLPKSANHGKSSSLDSNSSPNTLIVSVNEPQKESDGTKDAYVSYQINTETTLPQYRRKKSKTRRRFTDFLYLYQALIKEYPASAVPPLPGKQKLEYIKGDRFSPDFMARRCASLDRFLVRIALHPTLRRSNILCIFLESNDWNAYMRKDNNKLSSPVEGGASLSGGSGVFEGLSDSLINAFSKIHKADPRFVDIKESHDRLDEDLSHVEKLISRVVRRQTDLEQDYADLALQMTKGASLETDLADLFSSFARSLESSAAAIKISREHLDCNYFSSLRDMSSYIASMNQLLKHRDQKQLDFEGLTMYLSKTSSDRDHMKSSPYASNGFFKSKVEDLRGIDHEKSRQDRIVRLDNRVQDLTKEVENAKSLSEMFDEEVVKEVQIFSMEKSAEMKTCLGELASKNIEFYEKMIKEWEEFIASQENTTS